MTIDAPHLLLVSEALPPVDDSDNIGIGSDISKWMSCWVCGRTLSIEDSLPCGHEHCPGWSKIAQR